MAEGGTVENTKVHNCVFCNIVNGSKTDQEILDQTDELLIIPDIKAHAKHHFLVITKEHVKNPTTLTEEHVQLVKNMNDFGQKFLESKNVDLSDTRIGFHWPPLVSVQHLHMHLIHPASSMSFIFRNVIFKTGFYFVTPEWLIEYIEKKKNKL